MTNKVLYKSLPFKHFEINVCNSHRMREESIITISCMLDKGMGWIFGRPHPWFVMEEKAFCPSHCLKDFTCLGSNLASKYREYIHFKKIHAFDFDKTWICYHQCCSIPCNTSSDMEHFTVCCLVIEHFYRIPSFSTNDEHM